MNNSPAPHYYTRQDLCAVLSISVSAIKRYEQRGELIPTRVGPRLVRYSAQHLEAFLSRKTRRNNPPDAISP